MFVAVPRYDRVSVGDPLLNVILQRRNPTRYDVVQPGIVTTAKTQREMVRSLAGTDVVVVWHDPRATRTEDNGSSQSSGVDILQRYLARDFDPARRFGVYEVLRRSAVRRRSSPPASQAGNATIAVVDPYRSRRRNAQAASAIAATM